MKVILISNYTPDRQESMLRFAKMLQNGITNQSIETEIWYPVVILGRIFSSTHYGLGKWLGYIDKWIIYPLILLIKSFFCSNKLKYHICDHSNAPYLAVLPPNSTSITCHDVLAIKGALGYPGTYCEASGMGRLLQKWILKNLLNSKKIATVSKYTLRELYSLDHGKNQHNREWKVIYNSFNARFYPTEKNEAQEKLIHLDERFAIPFLLHVGSDLPRKNRKLLVDMLILLQGRWEGNICFVGESMSLELKSYIQKNSLQNKVIELHNVSHDLLISLYSACDTFIFPSFSEGFGWPVIEAQACGANVITSNIDPMPEVGGEGVLIADPFNANSYVDAFLELYKDERLRMELREKGYQNIDRFSEKKMIHSYLDLIEIKQ